MKKRKECVSYIYKSTFASVDINYVCAFKAGDLFSVWCKISLGKINSRRSRICKLRTNRRYLFPHLWRRMLRSVWKRERTPAVNRKSNGWRKSNVADNRIAMRKYCNSVLEYSFCSRDFYKSECDSIPLKRDTRRAIECKARSFLAWWQTLKRRGIKWITAIGWFSAQIKFCDGWSQGWQDRLLHCHACSNDARACDWLCLYMYFRSINLVHFSANWSTKARALTTNIKTFCLYISL